MKQLEKTYAEFIYGLEGVDQELIEKYLSGFHQQSLAELREQIEEMAIRKNSKNTPLYEVEIDNYNMALSDVLGLLDTKLKEGQRGEEENGLH